MIQLGYYSQSQQAQLDESNDFENYDPSEFLMKKEEPSYTDQPAVVQEPYSEPYYSSSIQESAGGDEIPAQNFYGSFSQESFSASEYNFQQPQMNQMHEDLSQQQQPAVIIQDGGGLDDLDISDSDDDDDQNVASTSQNQMETSKEDDDGLWF
jgi:hypothetical protein